MIDLHIHTTHSDGLLSPREIIEKSKKEGLVAIAITDHDSIDGVEEALNYCNMCLEIIPGIELGIGAKDKYHILGLYIDIKSPDLLLTLSNIKRFRIMETIKLFRALSLIGIDVKPNELLDINKELTTHNVINLMINKGYIKNHTEAYSEYLGVGKAAYIPRYNISSKEKIMTIKKANGIAILAHPFKLNSNYEKLREKIIELKSWGLDGIEVYRPDQNKAMTEFLLKVAEDNDLMVTGGSDFHDDFTYNRIGRVFNNETIHESILSDIKKKIMK